MRSHNLVVSDDIEELIQFHARVALSANEKSEPLMVRIEHPRYGCTTMKCHLASLGDKDELRQINAIAMRGMEHGIELESADHPTYKCRLWAIQGHSLTGKTLRLDSRWYELGFDAWDHYELPHKDKFIATVELGPSDILSDWGIVELHYNGSVKIRGGEKGKVAWRTSSGRAEAMSQFVHEECSIAGNSARMQIARPAIIFTLNKNAFASPFAAFELIKEELNDVCRLLSLCYRKPVEWYDITLTVQSKSWEHGHLPIPRCRRTLFSGANSERIEPLIDRRALVKGGFEKLLKNYRACDRGVFNRVIAFLVASYLPESLETRFFLAQAALEGITNCLVRETGGNFSELKSLAKRINHCVQWFGVRTEDFWKQTSFENGLSSALAYRNRLFHGGGVDDFGALYGNLVRFRILTERLLIARLKWPDEMLWPHRDEALHLLAV